MVAHACRGGDRNTLMLADGAGQFSVNSVLGYANYGSASAAVPSAPIATTLTSTFPALLSAVTSTFSPAAPTSAISSPVAVQAVLLNR